MQRLGSRFTAVCQKQRQQKQASVPFELLIRRDFADETQEEGGELTKSAEEAVKLDNRGKPRLHGGRRLTRKEKGSWDTSDWAIEAGQQAPIWPTNVPVYDLQTQAPFLFEKSNPVFEGYKNLRQENPERFAELLQSETVELPPPREGASKILQWEVNLVFDLDPQTAEPHPLNRKVKCRVYLRDLQHEFNLSDAALQCIAKICGPRYNPNKGLLTLTSERYRDREENRLHIADMLNELVKEGQKMFPSDSFKESLDFSAALQRQPKKEPEIVEATA